MKSFITIVFLILYLLPVTGQWSFYHPDTIQEIRIYFQEKNWDHILDSLYIRGQEERHLAAITINGTPFDSVGIRYKGFSSVSVNRKKNPFNIKLNYVKNQDYDGIDKIKLSNVIQDPSFLREVLSYEIASQYMPASRANFSNVYINDTLWGLYTNVEAVNKDFLSHHFPDNDNVLFKCNPEQLDLNGENSNLSNSPGKDSSDYLPFYDLKSDYGWTDLTELIETLNERPNQIHNHLNVDRTLWMHAFNYALVNFDSYVGYAQNYYLYKDQVGQFNPIIWDLNMSFASFRLTDASENFDGFTIEQAKTIDPLLHINSVSILPRPLMRNLFENPTFKRMYLAHLRTIIDENFANGKYYQRGLEMQDLIDSDVRMDENKFYSYQDFSANLDSTVSDLIDYPGLTDLMEARTKYIEDYPEMSEHPLIEKISYQPITPAMNNEYWVNCNVQIADSVWLYYRHNSEAVFSRISMTDDGNNNDGAPNDDIYGIRISLSGNEFQYFIYAENDKAGQFSPSRAAYEFYSIDLFPDIGGLVINELQAVNDDVISDEHGEFDDWIELFNNSNQSISLNGLYLSDDPLNIHKWPLPDLILPANEYALVWCDNQIEQGDFHSNFKLSSMGEKVFLSTSTNTILDSVNYGIQSANVSLGRFPNGTGPFRTLFPTPGSINSVTGVNVGYNSSISISPNPVKDHLTVFNETGESGTINIRHIQGSLIHSLNFSTGQNQIDINVSALASGPYLLEYKGETNTTNHQLFIVQ
jgi:spore coat protein CotH